MKILLIHYRYSIIGGPERYLFNIIKLLQEKGHEVIPFSINYKDNLESKYSEYFVEPASQEFHVHKISKFSTVAIKTGINLFYNKTAYLQLNKLIKDTKPDIAYLLLFSKFSTSILKSLKENNIPIILRISDFIYLCSRGVFMMNNQICEKCLNCSIQKVINKCTNDSYPLSIIDFFRRIFDKKSGNLKYINELIIPSKFTASYYSKNSYFPKAKISHIPTFSIISNKSNLFNYEKTYEKRFLNKVITVFGRVSQEKGLDMLINAIKHLNEMEIINYNVNIIGFTDSEFSISLKNKIIDNNINNINCYEFIGSNELNTILENSTYTIIPSICYDNMPNSLIESAALGLPIIASNIGSFPELITDSYNGFLFNVNDYIDLSNIIKKAFLLKKNKYIEMCNNSLYWANNYCSKESHYEKLMTVFNRYKKG